MLLWPSGLEADTIYLKEKKSLKGVIVEEQADRYILSTMEGELPVLKAVVEAVKYDDPERGYYQLGLQLQRAGRLQEALAAFEKSVEIRPDFEAAKEAAFTVRRQLWRQDESEVLTEIEHKQLIMQQAGRPAEVAGTQPVTKPAASVVRFEERYGCDVQYNEGITEVVKVRAGGRAETSGLEAGDKIVAIANEPIQNLRPDEVSRRLDRDSMEISLTIERRVVVEPAKGRVKGGQGFEVQLGYDGLHVTKVVKDGPVDGRLAVGDLLVEVDGRSTRYVGAEGVAGGARGGIYLVRRLVVLR